jgi:hypothetical protein
MSSHDLGLSAAIAVLLLGVLFFWRLSWYGADARSTGFVEKIRNDIRIAFSPYAPARESFKLDTFDTFFLGGKRVGGALTGQTYWSLCFAFANAIWYFAYLGYTYGPWCFLLQLPWTLSIFFLARYSLHYIDASANGTVHGFIGRSYGSSTAVLAAIATCVGYILNCGFEIFYSIYLLAVAFDFKSVALIVAVCTVFYTTSCIVAGGYSANVRTDFWKNLFGVVGVVLLLLILFPVYLNKYPTVGDALTKPWVDAALNKWPPWHFVVGITVFAFFFNFVDMANWQSLAANQDVSPAEKRLVKRELFLSGCKQLFAPALVGVCLGVMLKVLEPNMRDEEYFRVAFGSALPSLSLIYGLALGLILLGLMSAAISSVDNYLLAAMQTLAVDIFKRRQIAEMKSGLLSSEQQRQQEKEVIDWCKRYMPLLGAFMVVVFAVLFYKIEERVFAYQFVMYGAAVTLFPVVLGAFRARNRASKGMEPAIGPISSAWAFLSILTGLIFVFGCFFASASVQSLLQALLSIEVPEAVITDLPPVFGLVAAGGIYALGMAHRRWRKSS